MAENLIPKIAKMLGVEIGEEFKVTGIYRGMTPTKIFLLSLKGLLYRSGNQTNWQSVDSSFYEGLLQGEFEIVKLPWKPKLNQTYFTFGCERTLGYGRVWVVELRGWEGSAVDIALLEKGWVYRTEEEAKEALPKVAEELGVDYEL